MKTLFFIVGLLCCVFNLSAQSTGEISSQYQGRNSAKESVENLIDGDVNTKYYIWATTSFWIKISETKEKKVIAYIVASANDMPARDPRSWILQASTDDTNWIDIDTQKDQLFENRKLEKTYQIKNNAKFRHYRLLIESNNGDKGTQLSEFRLIYK